MLFDTHSEPTVAPVDSDASVLDPRRLHVYAVALEFQLLACRAVPSGHGALKDQLERASVTIVLNIAEGAGHAPPVRRPTSTASPTAARRKCSAVFDLLRIRQLVGESLHQEAHAKLVRIAQMLTRLEASMFARSAAR